jgi:hypothetical protein
MDPQHNGMVCMVERICWQGFARERGVPWRKKGSREQRLGFGYNAPTLPPLYRLKGPIWVVHMGPPDKWSPF